MRRCDGVDSELKHVVDKFREEEIAHKETAIEQGARDAPGYPVLSAVIKFGCRAAIRISEKDMNAPAEVRPARADETQTVASVLTDAFVG